MRLSTKFVVIFMLSMAVCLALGLWIHGRLVVALRTWSLEEETWVTLEGQSERLFPALRGAKLSGPSDDERRSDSIRPTQKAVALADDVGVVFVDSHWRVVDAMDAVPGGERENGFDWSGSERVVWTGSRRGSGSLASNDEPVRGTLQTPAGPRLALACPLKDQGGYAIVYDRTGSTLADSDTSVRYLSAVGAITFVWTLGLQCIAVYLIFTHAHQPTNRKQPSSEEMVMRRTQDLVRTRDAVIFGLAKLAESRDPDTGQHLERISMYSTQLATALRGHPDFRKTITPAFVRLIGISSALHDIGKVGIHDSILLKPGPLTAEERAHIQSHTAIGGVCLSQIEQRLGNSNFLYMAREIALHHHEHWDGRGYPEGLAGEEIPLAARIVAVADVYDALSSKRVYKDPFPHERCVRLIEKQSGKQFDPRIVRVFLEIAGQFREIAIRYADSPDVLSARQRTFAEGRTEGEDQAVGTRAVEEAIWALTDEAIDEACLLNVGTEPERTRQPGFA